MAHSYIPDNKKGLVLGGGGGKVVIVSEIGGLHLTPVLRNDFSIGISGGGDDDDTGIYVKEEEVEVVAVLSVKGRLRSSIDITLSVEMDFVLLLVHFTWFFFRPLPGGIPVIARVVMLGVVPDETYHSKKVGSSFLVSAIVNRF